MLCTKLQQLSKRYSMYTVFASCLFACVLAFKVISLCIMLIDDYLRAPKIVAYERVDCIYFFFSQETTSSTAFIKEQIYSNGSPMKQTKQLKTKILAITNDMKVNVILAVE